MTRVRVNIAGNIAGQAVTVLLALACTPFYVRLLGVEAYGLLAFYIVVQTIVQLVDFGLNATVNREIARSFGRNEDKEATSLGIFVTTLERWYWFLGCGVGFALFLMLPPMAAHWLQAGSLQQEQLTASAQLFAMLALLQWPSMFYQSALAGLQRQLALNLMQIPFATLGSVGGVLLIWLGPRSIAALITWQAIALAGHLAALYAVFWKSYGAVPTPRRFCPGVLWRHWRFTLGMSGITITGVILAQMDKLILSRILPLQSFGHYSLAGTVAKGLYVLITPVFAAYFPRLSALAATGNDVALKESYHTACQALSVLVLPAALLLALFAEDVITLWLRDADLASSIAPLASLMIIGTCLNGLMNIPFALQLAHGRTDLGLYINIGLVGLLVPALVYATNEHGAVGAASIWAAANALYLTIGLPLTHKYLLPGEVTTWLIADVLPALATSILVVGTSRALLNLDHAHVTSSIISIGLVWSLATIAAGFTSDRVRALQLAALRRLFRRI
jgi:O-antigen/teichoic acid export membrane protein